MQQIGLDSALVFFSLFPQSLKKTPPKPKHPGKSPGFDLHRYRKEQNSAFPVRQTEWEISLNGTGDNHISALPLFEVSVKHPVGESLPANADTFQDTITAELMQDQECIHFACRGKTRLN